jgi:hypothetical protein
MLSKLELPVEALNCHVSDGLALPVCLFENPYRLVSLWDMFLLHTHKLFELVDELRDLEGDLGRNLPYYPTPEQEKEISETSVIVYFTQGIW